MSTIITCGVYGFTAETFEDAIIAADVDIFVDIRRKRGVRGKQFSFANSQRLQEMLSTHAIPYIHRLDLAPSATAVRREGEIDHHHRIARHDRDTLSEEFITTFRKDVLDEFNARTFIDSLGDVDRVLLFCVEKTPKACHRGLVAEAIVEQLGWHREDLI